jgi:hypothetical protein
MLKVTNKYLFIGLVGIALALIVVWPITCLHLVTDFVWWQIALVYTVLNLPALIGLLLIVNVWGTFDMKKEAQEKH